MEQNVFSNIGLSIDREHKNSRLKLKFQKSFFMNRPKLTTDHSDQFVLACRDPLVHLVSAHLAKPASFSLQILQVIFFHLLPTDRLLSKYDFRIFLRSSMIAIMLQIQLRKSSQFAYL